MKRLISLLLVFIIIFTMFGCAKKETKSLTEYNNSNPKDMSFISVKDGYLVNEDGEEIVLKGVNLGNWLLWETWMGFVPEYTDDWAYFDTLEVLLERFGEEKTNEIIRTFEDNFITEEDIAQIEKLGFNCVRVPFWYRNFMTEDLEWLTEKNDDNPGWVRFRDEIHGNEWDFNNTIMLNRGNTVLPYEPYSSEPIDTKQIHPAIQALPGYGKGIDGTYNNHIDFERKVYVQMVKSVDLSDLSWYQTDDGNERDGWHNSADVTDMIHSPDGSFEQVPVLCEKFDVGNFGDPGIFIEDNFEYTTIHIHSMNKEDVYFYGKKDVGELLYPLATPIETDISAYLTDDDYIKVVGCGSIVAENERKLDAPSEITYLTRL